MPRALITGINGQDGSYLAELLLEKGYDPQYGARPLRRAIQKMVEDSLSNLMLEGTVRAGEKVSVSVTDGELKFETEKK